MILDNPEKLKKGSPKHCLALIEALHKRPHTTGLHCSYQYFHTDINKNNHYHFKTPYNVWFTIREQDLKVAPKIVKNNSNKRYTYRATNKLYSENKSNILLIVEAKNVIKADEAFLYKIGFPPDDDSIELNVVNLDGGLLA